MVKNTYIHVMEPTPDSRTIRCSLAPPRLQSEPGLSTSTSDQDSDISYTRTSDGSIGLSSCLTFDDMPFRIYELTRAFARLEGCLADIDNGDSMDEVYQYNFEGSEMDDEGPNDSNSA
mmetsp:Transcript_48580/g.128368  ORF Transcript_48580/g.128368 Transcript_48580/m.128368 type:complete len:118 (-) Transcript_48580:72-425(-)